MSDAPAVRLARRFDLTGRTAVIGARYIRCPLSCLRFAYDGSSGDDQEAQGFVRLRMRGGVQAVAWAQDQSLVRTDLDPIPQMGAGVTTSCALLTGMRMLVGCANASHSGDDVGQALVSGRDGDGHRMAGNHVDIEVLGRVAQDDRRGLAGVFTGHHADEDAVGGHLGHGIGRKQLECRVDVPVFGGKQDEQLETPVRHTTDRLFGMREAPSEEVAFDTSGDHGARVAKGVLVIEGTADAVRDDLDAPVRMGREHHVGWHVIVHHGDEWIDVIDP